MPCGFISGKLQRDDIISTGRVLSHLRRDCAVELVQVTVFDLSITCFVRFELMFTHPAYHMTFTEDNTLSEEECQTEVSVSFIIYVLHYELHSHMAYCTKTNIIHSVSYVYIA